MSVYIPPRPQALAAPAAAEPTSPTPAWGKAGPVGLGAGVLQTEFPLFALGNSPQHKMRRAWQLAQGVAYVFAAERTISGKLSTMGPTQEAGEVGWHLEDPDGERIDDAYPDPVARAAFQLLDKPMGALTLEEAGGMRLTRRQLWDVTSRHMGLCGQGAWVYDQLDGWGWPRAILYCRPDRLTPEPGPQGALAGWRLDKGVPSNPEGTPLELEEVALLYLQAPDEGWFSTGLVEAALVKAQLNGNVDKFYAQMLSGGGRLSGILAPRNGAITDEPTYQQLVRDWRNVVEQPEAAKRLQVVRAPVDFTRTVGTPAELGLTELMTRNRDDLLALWGVPYSQLGGSPAAGMGMGEARDSDRQALFENAVMPRGAELEETIQDILDRLLPVLGWAPRFVWDWPDLVPQATKYDQAQKASSVPLKNSERRAILGLQPFGERVLGPTGAPLDEEVWTPMTIQPVVAAVESSTPVLPEAPEPPPQLLPGQEQGPEGETEQEAEGQEGEGEESEAAAVAGGKARLRPTTAGARVVPGVAKLRATVERKVTPELKRSVAATLKDQGAQVAARVRSKWSSIKDAPKDDSLWWGRKGSKDRERPWDAPLLAAVRPALEGVGQVVSGHIREQLGPVQGKATGPADQRAIDWALRYGSGRITRINDWTRAEVRKLIAQAIEQGMSPLEAGDLVEGWSGWDEYRAERIARTELMFAYNAAALDTYAEYAVTEVEALDGDEDEECAARNGQVYSLPDAAAIMDHPNGTLDWAPIFTPGG